MASTERVPTFCALCVSRCGAIATIDNGTFSALEPDPSHPTGKALCIKGKVAPELVYHPERLLHPLERTRPKSDADPGWRRIGWDEALDKIASRLLALSREHGPESVVFSSASPSTSAISDSLAWIERLRRAFGSPNLCASVELCAWGRYFASSFTFGMPVPGMYLPDLERAGCILFWGYDLFMNPTAELADIVLPVASPFETEALATGFEISAEAQSLVQLRRPVVSARGESRSDLQIIFALATRLGLGHHFWNGDIDAAFRHQLEPSSLTLEALRAEPRGLRVALETRHQQYAAATPDGLRGFFTPSGTIELYSETLLEHGYPALPDFDEPSMSPRARPDLAERFPLVLTCAKSTWFCESQHRALPSLRRRAPDPLVEIHPDTACARDIAEGDWVRIHTPSGSVRARASFNPTLEPGVVCGQHGWWQACDAIGAPGYDPFGPDGANLNLLVRHEPSDDVGGSVPHRAYLCNVLPEASTER
jgi:anaerobic selenocysteine-containing dehydrogenase